MCGIAGYIRSAGLLDGAILDRMLLRIRHRGPDGHKTWTSPPEGLAFAHARLKVQDLSDAADQPMHAADGSTSLLYNGEVYNFRELRDELSRDGARFRSTGDTEVLLELCRRDPDLRFLNRLSGMFAFALWHKPTRALTLVRDRTGVKPLLFSEIPGGLAFASEMAALRPALEQESIDQLAIAQLLTLGFIAAPRTIFKQVQKLRPGCLLRFQDGCARIQNWADALPSAQAPMSFEEACTSLRERFAQAVRGRLLADVPVGVFLSGGIDSAIVAAVAARQSSTRVKTFSVTFPGHPYFDESRYSNAVARMHDTDHTVLPLSLDEIRSIIPTVQSHLGEPFADSSALPTYLLSRLTRQHVTVALSGDGADELFAGYNRYAATRLIDSFGWFGSQPLYPLFRRWIEGLPTRRENKIGGIISQLKRAMRSLDPRPPHRYANWMRTSDDNTLAMMLDRGLDCTALVESIVNEMWQYRGEPREENNLNHHLRTEWQSSLPDDMLTKVDLMSMAHGLEVRSPFLDKDLVNLVFPMRPDWKLSGWRKKHLLIEAYRDLLPPLLHDRPKKGFEVPVGPWLRGPLYPFARDLIDSDRCFFGTALSREGARRLLDDHAAGRADHNFCLWALVSLLAWQQEHAPSVAVA